MKEIKINVSIKRVIIVFLVAVGWLAVMFGVKYHLAGQDYKVLETIGYLLCLMILYFVFYFYFGRRTRLIITDVQLRVNAPEPWVVQLSGVDSFYVGKYKGRKFIGIRYKDNVEAGITEEEIAKDRKQRFEAALQGYPYEVYVGFLSLKPQEICDLLNARINQ